MIHVKSSSIETHRSSVRSNKGFELFLDAFFLHLILFDSTRSKVRRDFIEQQVD